MIPIAQALHVGGIRGAYECYEEILNQPDYFSDPYDLITLVYQLLSVKKFDLAKEVLQLNLHAFPKHQGTISMLAKVSMLKDT